MTYQVPQLGSAATSNTSAFDSSGAAASAQSASIGASCQRASNLSDVASPATCRSNLLILSGTATLTAGTVTIPAVITASSRILVTIQDANPGAGNLTIGLAVPSAGRTVGTSFIVRANIAAGTINVLDTSTFDWDVIG